MIDKAIDDLPPKAHKWLTVILFVAVSALLGLFITEYNPKVIVVPIQAQVNTIQTQVDALNNQFNNLANRFDNADRWMCHSDYDSAHLAGIRCDLLGIRNEGKK